MHNWIGENPELMPEKYRGMDTALTRKAVVADLEALGLLVETKKTKLMVPICTRTGQGWSTLTDGSVARQGGRRRCHGQSIAQEGHRRRGWRPGELQPENWSLQSSG